MMPVSIAFHGSAILISIGIVITCLEVHAAQGHYGPSGLMNWGIVRTCHRWTIQGTVATLLDAVFYPRGFMWLNWIRLGAALAIILVSGGLWNSRVAEVISLILAFSLTGLFHIRNPFGLDGSDQMTVIMLAVLMLWSFAPDNKLVSLACLTFVALQSALVYLTSGWAKMSAVDWRSGVALAGVMNTNSYGSKRLAKFLLSHTPIAKAFSWILILFQICFPLVLFLGKYALVLLAAGIVFHVQSAGARELMIRENFALSTEG
jgi:hypothetical protein